MVSCINRSSCRLGPNPSKRCFTCDLGPNTFRHRMCVSLPLRWLAKIATWNKCPFEVYTASESSLSSSSPGSSTNRMCCHPLGFMSSINLTTWRSCLKVPKEMESLQGVYESSSVTSTKIEICVTTVFLGNSIRMKCGCGPSDCQRVCTESSRKLFTPKPGFALETDQSPKSPRSTSP